MTARLPIQAAFVICGPALLSYCKPQVRQSAASAVYIDTWSHGNRSSYGYDLEGELCPLHGKRKHRSDRERLYRKKYFADLIKRPLRPKASCSESASN